jgi:predicted transcriptional regulator
MNEVLDQEKQKIRNLVSRNPGLHLTKIAETLQMPIEKLLVILEEMEQSNIITYKIEAGYKRYYLSKDKAGFHDRKISEIRDNIYNIVESNPGLNLTKIAETVDMRISHVEYHLSNLEKTGHIIVVKDAGYKRYYSSVDQIEVSERKTLALLRQELPLKIVILLLKNKKLTHKEILKNFNIAPSTLTYHLNKLLRENIIDLHTYGKEKGYSIKNRGAVVRFFTKYKLGKMVESFGDTWDALKYKK